MNDLWIRLENAARELVDVDKKKFSVVRANDAFPAKAELVVRINIVNLETPYIEECGVRKQGVSIRMECGARRDNVDLAHNAALALRSGLADLMVDDSLYFVDDYLGEADLSDDQSRHIVPAVFDGDYVLS